MQTPQIPAMAGMTPLGVKPECEGHPAGPFDPMGQTVYCDGFCAKPMTTDEIEDRLMEMEAFTR